MARMKYSLMADEELGAILSALKTAMDSTVPDAQDGANHQIQLQQIEMELQSRELREVRQRLAESHHRYDELFQSSPVGYLSLSSAGVVQAANPAACTILGRSRDSLVANPFTSLLESAVVPGFLNHLRLCREKKEQVSLELTVRQPSGLAAVVQVFTSPLPDGDALNFRTMLLDVTEKRNMERELARIRDELESRVQERTDELTRLNDELSAEIRSRICVEQNFAMEHQRFFTILDELPAYVILHQEDYSIRFANRMFREHFGNHEGKSCHELMYRRDKPCEACMTQQIFRDKQPQIRGSRTFSDDNRAFEIYAYPYTDIDGASLVLTLAIDITEREKSTDERCKIEKLDSLGVLAGGIAHDYNNLLTAIIGNINLACQTEGVPTDAIDLLMEAEHASLRAKGLTRQLLTFAQGGAPVKEAVSLSQVVQDSAAFALSGSKIRSDFTTDDHLSPVAVDAGQMSQVIQTLVTNAAEAMPKGGTIQVHCENRKIFSAELLPLTAGDYVCIAVTDTGCGIPQEHLGKIFDPYFTTKTKGSGLGLASAYSMVKRHGGHITVDSHLGSGSTFRVYLPVAEVAQVPMEPVAEQLGTPVAQVKKRVLVMDDEAVLRKVTGVMLGSFGYEVEAAADGEEALERYMRAREEGRPFDVVILDLTIPGGMGGEEAIQKLHEIDPEVKAIVSSGYCDNPVLADFSMYGFAAILPKPYRLSEMGAVVARVLAGNC